MPQPAARQNDPVTGTDTHILLVPPGAVPTPTPLPFVGQLMISLSPDVLVDGKPLARLGDPVATCNDPVDLPVCTITAGSPDVLVG